MLRAIDQWVGRTLFVPLVVRVCQRAGWTQFHAHNFLYLVGSWMLLAAALMKRPDSASLTFLMAVVFTVKVGRDPGYRGEPSTFLRWAFLILALVHAISHLTGERLLFAGPDWDLSCPVGIMWLAAEYARTIKTIPPLEEPEPRRVVGEVIQ